MENTETERYWEINGNLDDESSGIRNYRLFEETVTKVKRLFDSTFGADLLRKVFFSVDNATAGSGYTPITTVVLGKIVVIKLGIAEQDPPDRIAYQFAHELMHVVYQAVFGLNKPRANQQEETVCSAAALITIKALFPASFDTYQKYVSSLTNEAYREGARCAFSANYDLGALMQEVKNTRY